VKQQFGLLTTVNTLFVNPLLQITGEELSVLRELDVASGSVRDRMVGPSSPFSENFSTRAGRLAYAVNSGGHHNIWRGAASQCPPGETDYHDASAVLPAIFAGWKACRFRIQSRWPTRNLDEQCGWPRNRAIDESQRPGHWQPNLVSG
jgi:hypothetical protein